MDGASKFLRGDAVAGLLITFINVIGGVIIGMAQMDMSIADAGASYTLLTVGDGLVSQVPALIVSTAAGLLVSKAGVDGAADKALVSQLSGYPKALGMSSFVMVVMSILPGIPMIPFLALAGGAGTLAWKARGKKQDIIEHEAAEAEAEAAEAPTEEPISTALHMDDLRLELGYGLLPLINGPEGDKLTSQIRALRRQMAGDMGFIVPSVRILDNMHLDSNDYVIKIKEVEAGRGSLQPGLLMVMDPSGAQVDLPGHHTTEPTFELPATWIEQDLREEASIRGYTVVDAPTVLATHLTELLKTNMPDMLSYAEVRKLLDELPDEHGKLLEDIVPGQISISGIQRILQTLLGERVSIRDLPTILEGVAEATGYTQNPAMITEHVRSRLARQICAANLSPDGYLPLISLSPEWEQHFAESIIGDGDDRQLAMAPSQIQEFITRVRDEFEAAAQMGENPVLLTSAQARPFVRSIMERFRPQTAVLSQNEIHARTKLKSVGSI
jgi:flagellar biosynthesis protein FlhA